MGYSVENPDIDYEEERWQNTPLSVSNTNAERLLFNSVDTNITFWAGIQLPARGTRQHRIPTTPSKLCTGHPTLRFPEVDKACVYAFGMLPGFLENLLQSGNLFCSAMAATKIALGVSQLWFNYFRSINCMYSSWETKQRDAAVVVSITPVSPFCEWGWSVNLSVPSQNVIQFDTHESAEPSSVLSTANSLSNFSRIALSSI